MDLRERPREAFTFLKRHQLLTSGAVLMLSTTSLCRSISLACDFSCWGQSEAQIQAVYLYEEGVTGLFPQTLSMVLH